MKKVSAGILIYRRDESGTEVLLVHMGGPFWAKKDNGAWSIPKGEVDTEEDLLETALREFKEETGFEAKGELVSLGSVVQKSGKEVHVWTTEGNINAENIKSNTFTMEWPPRSGKMQEFPENDRAEYFELEIAKEKVVDAQRIFIDRLQERLERCGIN